VQETEDASARPAIVWSIVPAIRTSSRCGLADSFGWSRRSVRGRAERGARLRRTTCNWTRAAGSRPRSRCDGRTSQPESQVGFPVAPRPLGGGGGNDRPGRGGHRRSADRRWWPSRCCPAEGSVPGGGPGAVADGGPGDRCCSPVIRRTGSARAALAGQEPEGGPAVVCLRPSGGLRARRWLARRAVSGADPASGMPA
jgi:hypothetical protein